ncbi:MAG TPA: nuclear transport factor 2 family protein [Steroidobacteraceae bacterium]|nr:nuclear transport factor 2 family protein [Steroidobacteraceae bacterium]
MNRRDYDDYLARFNACDYDGVLAYYAPRFELSFAGYSFTTREEVKSLYRFLHAHVKETVVVEQFLGSETFVAMEARVLLTGVRDLTPQLLAAQGLDRLGPLAAGQVVEIPQFIHYHLQDGKITRALCAVFQPGPAHGRQ